MCILKYVVQCPDLRDPMNGMISCTFMHSPVSSYEDTCSFTCNTGYELTGSSERTCQSDGSWSGSPVSCIIMECPSSSLPMNSMLAESCSSTYQSMCELKCQEGFNGTGDPSYVCDVLSDGSSVVMWMAEGDTWGCERRNAPINIMPHYPPPGQCWGIGGDLNFAKFKCTTYWACQSVKSQPSPHSTIKEKMGNLTIGAFNCSTCIWQVVKFPTYGASFSVKTGQMPHLFPYIAREGGSGA